MVRYEWPMFLVRSKRAFLGGVVASALVAAAASAAVFTGPQYRACVAKIAKTPDQAFEDALAWRGQNGGLPAEHCAALALLAMKQPGNAAQRFESIARNPSAGAAGVRAGLFGQAGNAWLLARRGREAEAALTAAIKLVPRNVEFLVDRARARALMRNWAGADADLSAALAAGGRPDIYLLRATARRALNRMREARADIDAALFINPRYAEALVERGSMKLIAGDKPGARRDWLQVLLIAPNGPAGDEARRRIEDLEINPNR
jgi:tetratricopeptide (TPR) repeat protein